MNPISPTVVELDKTYTLLEKITTGATSIVWMAQPCLAPGPGTQVTREWLRTGELTEAPSPDPDLPRVAIKVARPTHENMLRAEAERLIALRRIERLRERVVQIQADQSQDPVPVIVMEWVTGTPIDALTSVPEEREGLRLARELVETIRLIFLLQNWIPTDTIKANGVFINTQASPWSCKLIDWGIVSTAATDFRTLTIPTLGATLYRLFTGEVVGDGNNSDRFGSGRAAAAWGQLAYGTQALIRKLVLGDVQGQFGADLGREVADAVEAQLNLCAQDRDRLALLAQGAEGAGRLNLHDLAGISKTWATDADQAHSPEAEAYRAALQQLFCRYLPGRQHAAALADLGWARARYRALPEWEGFLRWHWLAHLAAILPSFIQDRAWQVLCQALGLLQKQEWEAAANLLEQTDLEGERTAWQALAAEARARQLLPKGKLNLYAEAPPDLDSPIDRVRSLLASVALATPEDLLDKRAGLARDWAGMLGSVDGLEKSMPDDLPDLDPLENLP